MTHLILILLLVVSTNVPLPGARTRPPVAAEDHYFLLFNPLPVVEIPVLENDHDPDGDVLTVKALHTIEGGKAEIIDGRIVRVYLDWSREYAEPEGLVAYGVYVVSDGQAESWSVWSVWYWPVIPL